MNDVPIIFIVILLIVIIVAYQSIAIAAENERFATFFLGRFQAYMGPGLVLKTNLQKLHRLAVGDIGVISGSGFVKFGEVDVPVSIPESIRVGDSVRIDSFNENGPIIAPSVVSPKRMCPSCGHAF